VGGRQAASIILTISRPLIRKEGQQHGGKRKREKKVEGDIEE